MLKVKAFLHTSWNKWADPPQFTPQVYNCDMTEYGYVLIETRELEFETPPEQQMRLAAAQALKAKLLKKQAEAYVECQEIQKEIDEMLALEYKPAAEKQADLSEAPDDIPF